MWVEAIVNSIYLYSAWLIIGSMVLERTFEKDIDNV